MAKKKAMDTKKLNILTSAGIEESAIWDFLADSDGNRKVVEELASQMESGEIGVEEVKKALNMPLNTDVVINDYPDAYEIDAAFTEDGYMSVEKCRDLFPDASESDLKRVVGITNALIGIQERQSGLVQRTAYLLWALEVTGAYKVIGYKTVTSYAKEVLGISSKGSVSDAINTYRRFGEISGIIDWEAETAGQIKPQYADFNFSTLMRMKKLTDDEIAEMGITPNMSRSQVVQTINETLAANAKAVKDSKEKQKMLDGSVEKEIESELQHEAEESSTVEQQSGEEQEAPSLVDLTITGGKYTYKRGDNFDEYIMLVTESLKEQVQKALDEYTGVDVFTVETLLFKDVMAGE